MARSLNLALSPITLLLVSKASHVSNAFPARVPLLTRTLQEDELCSCSPTVFEFVLSLSQTCDNNDILSNSGIEGSFCFVDPISDDEVPTAGVNEEGESIRQRLLQDSAPVEIISVQFLEFDTQGDLKVINQDDTYVDVSLADGDTLKFYSKSSFLDGGKTLEEQMDYVPGGASLILYGRTGNGDLVRNRFFWTYDMSCGGENEPIKSGDKIGWTAIVSFYYQSTG